MTSVPSHPLRSNRWTGARDGSTASALPRMIKLLVLLLIGKMLVSVVLNYRDYLPPNFQADFLLGREGYFWHGYHWSFYPHIFAGPCSLILGTLLMSEAFRRRFPRWHRRLGRVQGMCVLFVVAPSGLAMAFRAASGPVAGAGFAVLALLTAGTVGMGWRTAVQRRFDRHRRWMTRCYILLCSTVVVRVNGGVGAFLGIGDNWFYTQTAWTSWLVPLVVYEAIQWTKRTHHRAPTSKSFITASQTE